MRALSRGGPNTDLMFLTEIQGLAISRMLCRIIVHLCFKFGEDHLLVSRTNKMPSKEAKPPLLSSTAISRELEHSRSELFQGRTLNLNDQRSPKGQDMKCPNA